jgi:inosine-5''-monophosphate dehydrogenase (EC 1.1.1.205)
MFKEKFQSIREGLTYDDVLLVPSRTAVEPKEIDVSSRVSRHIQVKIPLLSSPMDTVTEAQMAISWQEQEQ